MKKLGYLAMGSDGRLHIGLDDYGLHCGECLDVYEPHTQQWTPTRIEHTGGAGWVLIGINRPAEGQYVRQGN